MKFRTIALALVVACGVTATVEAKTPKQHTLKRTYKAQKYKKPKFKTGKSPKIKHHA
jgi:hypothetical protein